MCKEVLRKALESFRAPPAQVDPEERARLAAAALMVECARIDAELREEERHAIAESVRELFQLDPDMAEMLLAVAEKRVEDVWHDWLFTEAIREGFDPEARAQLVRRLCFVARANGSLGDREQAFIGRIARELGVPEERVREAWAAAPPAPGSPG
jgi:uncharacterized tellurite resistance protein B-like protein